MGRRFRWLVYSLKSLVVYCLLAALLWFGYHAAAQRFFAPPTAQAFKQMEGSLITLTTPQLEQILKQKATSLIFIYDSEGLLSRWYFPRMHALASEYAAFGVRPLFISTDADKNTLLRYLATRKHALVFQPLFIEKDEARQLPSLFKSIGGDTFAGMAPYLAVMDEILFLRDFSPLIVRTGKLRSALNIAIDGAR